GDNVPQEPAENMLRNSCTDDVAVSHSKSAYPDASGKAQLVMTQEKSIQTQLERKPSGGFAYIAKARSNRFNASACETDETARTPNRGPESRGPPVAPA
ncbi:MAG: hypothetical protein J0L78_16105, partial [Planctomycetes bacterium]|nr:hypothetical protein [Planctomycetota bacterium]